MFAWIRWCSYNLHMEKTWYLIRYGKVLLLSSRFVGYWSLVAFRILLASAMGIRIFCVNPIFHASDIGWNLGLTGKFHLLLSQVIGLGTHADTRHGYHSTKLCLCKIQRLIFYIRLSGICIEIYHCLQPCEMCMQITHHGLKLVPFKDAVSYTTDAILLYPVEYASFPPHP